MLYWVMTKWESEMVPKVRADKDLGIGSCSTLDECFSDTQLAQELSDIGIMINESWPKLRKYLMEIEKVFWERQGLQFP